MATRRGGRTRASAIDDDGAQRRFAERVGASVRALRLARGMTQATLASAAALSANFVARVERGELGLSLFVAQRLARTLETELAALLTEPKPRAPGISPKRTPDAEAPRRRPRSTKAR